MCGGMYVKAVNKTQTKCFDGTKADECYVASIDHSPLGLSGTQSEEVMAAIREGRVLLSGEMVELDAPAGGFASLLTYKAFEAETGNTPTGTYYVVEPSGITCIKAPCPSLQARKINGTSIKQVTDVDFSSLGLTPEEEEAFISTIWEKNLVVSGKVSSVSSSIGTKKVLKPSEIFSTVEPIASQQLCQDDAACGEGMVCDHTECLSNCAPDMVCPAVCWGACVEGSAPSPQPGSCVASCGGSSPDDACYCDDVCEYYGDCCDDFAAVCAQ
ncbi:MAG: hypothetical protein HOV80_20070 [Polyangiaceae bacterium]|nr:hypothetical protein [Polyangiaceae bacterium]